MKLIRSFSLCMLFCGVCFTFDACAMYDFKNVAKRTVIPVVTSAMAVGGFSVVKKFFKKEDSFISVVRYVTISKLKSFEHKNKAVQNFGGFFKLLYGNNSENSILMRMKVVEERTKKEGSIDRRIENTDETQKSFEGTLNAFNQRLEKIEKSGKAPANNEKILERQSSLEKRIETFEKNDLVKKLLERVSGIEKSLLSYGKKFIDLEKKAGAFGKLKKILTEMEECHKKTRAKFIKMFGDHENRLVEQEKKPVVLGKRNIKHKRESTVCYGLLEFFEKEAKEKGDCLEKAERKVENEERKKSEEKN